MSNALSVATVTRALQRIVERAAQSVVGGASVVMTRPEANPGTAARIHLFLYQVLPDAAHRNEDLPTRTGTGIPRQRPVAALDLHYLVTFTGDDAVSDPHKMLGAVARDLHAQPILSRSLLQSVATGDLAASNLAAAIDVVRITSLGLSTEELSKIWLMFSQIPYALSVAYQARVVLIDADAPATPAPPVLSRGKDDRGVDTQLGPYPALDSIEIARPGAPRTGPRLPSYPAAQLGLRLLLTGRNLAGDTVELNFVHPRVPVKTVTIPQTDRTASQIAFTIPSDAAAQTEWAAGVYTVTARITSGAQTRSTNVLALPFAPAYTAITPASPIAGAGTDLVLTLACAPQLAAGQRASLLLAGAETALEVAAPTANAAFTVLNAPAVASEFVYLRVDGVDSSVFAEQPGPPPKFALDPSKQITIT